MQPNKTALVRRGRTSLLRMFGYGLALFPATSLAQEQYPTAVGHEVVVTGTRLPVPADEMASSVTTITRSEIEARNASSVVELLRGIPGVVIEQAGSRGSVASVFIRGAKPNFTVVMIDGVKVNDETNTRGGSFDFSTLSLDLIQRIEIIRGPESAIYGSLGAGGVINIITLRGTGKSTEELNVSGGQFGYWRAEGEARGQVGAVPATFALSHTDNGSPVMGSNYRGTVLGGSVAFHLSDGWLLDLSARYAQDQQTSFPDSSGGPLLAVIRALDVRDVDEAVFGARAQDKMSSWWSQALQYGLYNRTSRENSPGVAPSSQDPSGIPPSFDDIGYRRQELNWTQLLSPARPLRVALGLNWQKENGADGGHLLYGSLTVPTSYVAHREMIGLYAEARWDSVEDWEFSAAGRDDYPSNAASRFTPEISAVHTNLPGGIKLRLSWSEGYKLPSFYALGNPIVGNPDLKPETSRNGEIGLSRSFVTPPLEVKISAFKTVFSNLIDFNPGPVPKLVNLTAVSVHGGEASAVLTNRGHWTLETYISYTVTKDQSTGGPLRDVPEWLAGGDIIWQPTLSTDVDLKISDVGSYIDNAVPTGDVRLSGYKRCDLSATEKLSSHLSLYIAVENLLDRKYEEAIGFPAPPVFARIGIRWAL